MYYSRVKGLFLSASVTNTSNKMSSPDRLQENNALILWVSLVTYETKAVAKTKGVEQAKPQMTSQSAGLCQCG
jgi:hypothetical protein